MIVWDSTIVKSYLSRGIAVSVGMHVPPYDPEYKFALYNGTYALELQCQDDMENNHAVTMVGYGRKNGIDVWVVKNSWGKDWGANGYFYVRRGRNDYCMERRAYSLIPEHYDANAGLFNRTNPPRYSDMDLDPDDGTLIRNVRDSGFNPMPLFVLVMTLIVLVIISILALIIYCCCCKKKK